MAAEVALGAIWKFLEPIMSDTIRDRLKPTKKAQKKAINLYKALWAVNPLTDQFVYSLQSLAEAIDEKAKIEIIHKKAANVAEVSEKLVATLRDVAAALYDINPQLDIIQPYIVRDIEQFHSTRGFLIKEYRQWYEWVGLDNLIDQGAFFDCNRLNSAEVRSLFDKAEENRKLIRKVTNDFREFVKSQFSFEELFL